MGGKDAIPYVSALENSKTGVSVNVAEQCHKISVNKRVHVCDSVKIGV